MASKLTKNLGPPTSTLHVANLPDDFTHAEVKVRAVVGSLCGVNMPNQFQTFVFMFSTICRICS